MPAHPRNRRNRRNLRSRRTCRNRPSQNRRTARTRPSGSALAALTSGALALPGISGSATAGPRIEELSADYSFAYYTEDPIPASKVAPGSVRERYDIAIHQFRIDTPFRDRADLAFDLVHETMSGATPWYVDRDSDGDPIQVMSGATIEDARTDVTFSGNYFFDRARTSLAVGYSTENDYRAVSGGLNGELALNDKNTTLSAGGSFSFDTIEPTADPLFVRPDKEKKNSYTAFAGISQVINRNAIAQTSLTYSDSSGYLSDPYKLAHVGGVNLADARPSRRWQISSLTQLRNHFDSLNGTLHADYRFYIDEWKMTSHTIELAWYQSLWDTVQIVPSLRYYSQSQAFFYAPFYDADRPDGLRSSDYRLSPYGALSWGIKADAQFHDWPFQMNGSWGAMFSWERYLSSGSFALGGVAVENPGLVSFHLFSFSLRARF